MSTITTKQEYYVGYLSEGVRDWGLFLESTKLGMFKRIAERLEGDIPSELLTELVEWLVDPSPMREVHFSDCFITCHVALVALD